MFGRVVPFKSLYETARFLGGESCIERGRRVRAEIVLNQHDLFGVRKMHVGQFSFSTCAKSVAAWWSVTLTSRQPSSGANIMNVKSRPIATPFRVQY